MRNWCIGIPSWIIQDGNYNDFHIHQSYDFAIEFYPKTWRPSSSAVRRARHVTASEYEVNAEIVQATSTAWVIDFGFPTYQQCRPPEGLRKGTWIEAVVHLGVDPFFYFEEIAHDHVFPPLIHAWHICGIELETTPFIENKDDQGTTLLVRDAMKAGFRNVERTNAWEDDDGNGHYVLNCELMSRHPKRHRCE